MFGKQRSREHSQNYLERLDCGDGTTAEAHGCTTSGTVSAIHTLIGWYRHDEDVDRLLPVLSTFLGHARASDTYWYISVEPELMGAAKPPGTALGGAGCRMSKPRAPAGVVLHQTVNTGATGQPGTRLPRIGIYFGSC